MPIGCDLLFGDYSAGAGYFAFKTSTRAHTSSVIMYFQTPASIRENFVKAYLVLGGEGWTLRDFYVSGDLRKHLLHADKVEIVTLESFVARANNGEL